MKKFLKYFMFILMVSSVGLAGCSDSDDDETPSTPTTTTFDVLKDYMVANNMDADVVISGWIIDAAGVNAKAPGAFYIMDIRSIDDFNLGHIDGAVHSSLGAIVVDAAQADKPILVACYTGQTAGHAVVALRLSGYADAKVLKFGMAGWSSTLAGPWSGNIGDEAANFPSSWAAAPGNITAPIVFNTTPNILSSSTDGAIILAERVAAMTTNGFAGVTNTAVLTAPADFFINNFWDEADVVEYGNIQSAFRLKPFTLAAETYKNLDPSEAVVTYCWTGQTSSMMTAYLYVMGYDAKSLKFGVNGMIYSDLNAHEYTVPTGANDYPVVPTK